MTDEEELRNNDDALGNSESVTNKERLYCYFYPGS